MPNAQPVPVRANNADELDAHLQALAIWRAQEVTLEEQPGTDASISFQDANNITRTVVFDTGVVDREAASRLIVHLGSMVYRGTESVTGGGTRYIYDRG